MSIVKWNIMRDEKKNHLRKLLQHCEVYVIVCFVWIDPVKNIYISQSIFSFILIYFYDNTFKLFSVDTILMKKNTMNLQKLCHAEMNVNNIKKIVLFCFPNRCIDSYLPWFYLDFR